uniref:Uncharacterized protein n=1 Tax=Anguilla anguilla TaxID=7936 RepID=A0A0E9XFD8_ANGAN
MQMFCIVKNGPWLVIHMKVKEGDSTPVFKDLCYGRLEGPQQTKSKCIKNNPETDLKTNPDIY